MTRRVERGRFVGSCERCGWSRVYSTTAWAERGERSHRCDRSKVCPICGGEKSYPAKVCQTCRVDGLDVDRTPKPCHHKEARHEHGHYATYALDGCRCWPCVHATTAYNQNRERQRAYGRDGEKWVDADVVRAYIRSLTDAGMGLKRIVAAAGVSSGTFVKLVYGVQGKPQTVRVRRETAERLLAVRLELADGASVPSLGSVRRLRALVALGWSQAKLAERLGMSGANFGTMMRQQAVTVRKDREIRALYDELALTLPPETNQRERIAASRARRHAKSHGWLPPLAWDDDRLDDPDYEPGSTEKSGDTQALVDHAVVERFLASGERARKLTFAESAEIVWRLQRRGLSGHEIDHRYGFKVERYVVREGPLCDSCSHESCRHQRIIRNRGSVAADDVGLAG